METFWITVAAVLWGAATGVLIPRAAYRLSVPPEEEWRATCPDGHAFADFRNGWRARCADGDSYGPSMPALAAITAAVCAVLASAVGAHPELLVWLVIVPMGVLLVTVDFTVERLPDVLTLPLAAISLGMLGVAALLPGTDGSWGRALLGSLAFSSFCLVVFLINPAAFGFGDVKLAPTVGAVTGWYGWDTLIAGVFTGFVVFVLYGLSLIVARRADRKTAHPLGPFLLAGAVVAVLLGALSS